MGWFKRKIKVGAEPLIKDRVEKAFQSDRDSLLEMLEAAKHEPNEREGVIYAAYQELLAMTLAGLDERVRYGYAEAAYQMLEGLEPGQGGLLQRRFSEYSSAFGNDAAAGKAHLAPGMIGHALESMFGASDESVVSARLALVMTHKACLEAKVPFFKDIKVID